MKNMEEEKKKVDTTTEAAAPADKGNEKAGEEKKPVDTTDYKAELEKVKAQLAKAEYTIVKSKKEKEKDDIEPGYDAEEEIKSKATEIARAETEKFKRELVSDTIEDEIAKIATSPEHAELIKHYYDNRIVKSGYSRKSISEDLNTAAVLVDRPRVEAYMKELKQKNLSDKTKNTGGQAQGHKEKTDDEIELTPADRKIMERFGLKESDISK